MLKNLVWLLFFPSAVGIAYAFKYKYKARFEQPLGYPKAVAFLKLTGFICVIIAETALFVQSKIQAAFAAFGFVIGIHLVKELYTKKRAINRVYSYYDDESGTPQERMKSAVSSVEVQIKIGELG